MPNILTYNFEFWEELSSELANWDLREDSYTVLDGDTLWSISSRFEIPIETLLSLNPNIKNPNQLIPGEKVKLQ